MITADQLEKEALKKALEDGKEQNKKLIETYKACCQNATNFEVFQYAAQFIAVGVFQESSTMTAQRVLTLTLAAQKDEPWKPLVDLVNQIMDSTY